MKKLLVSLFLSSAFLLPTSSSYARTVNIDVHGMTCDFSASSLERRFKSMKSVSAVSVSLKDKTVHLETEPTSPDLATIKQTIINAGFTPIKVEVK